MARLRYTPNSPFARKARVLAHEIGLAPSLELVPTALRTEDPAFWSDNPLGKVPVWITDDGLRLHDSNVICEYLNEVYGEGRYLPSHGPERWRALSLVSTADGMSEAGMLARFETSRAVNERSPKRISEEMGKVERGLDHVAREIEEPGADDGIFGLAQIAVACSLGWLELRFGRDFICRGRQPLANWWDRVSQRSSLIQTRPQADA